MRSCMCFIHITIAMAVATENPERAQTTEYQNRVATAMWNAEFQSRLNKSSGYRGNAYVCYELLGCFAKEPIGMLPEDPEDILPEYRLYTNVSWFKLSVLSFPTS